MDDEKQIEAKWTKKLKYSSMDYHLEEKLAMFISLPFSRQSVHSVLQRGENSTPDLWAKSVHTSPANLPALPSVWFCQILTNGFLTGLPQKQVKRLQVVENAAARIVMKCKQNNNKNRSCHSHS